jgi:hypothetical protein
MARFRSHAAFTWGAFHYSAGRTFADTQANALAGDVVLALTSANLPPQMNPLDASAIGMKNASALAGEVLRCTITGADSVSG